MDSIDFAQSKAKSQLSPLQSSAKKSLRQKQTVGEDLLEELGISSQQFQSLFRRLPQGIALYKPIYNRNSAVLPIDLKFRC